MKRVVVALGLALVLTGCGPAAIAVPLPTAQTDFGWNTSCILMHIVVDVVADPQTGAPIDQASGKAFVWPPGMTARRNGSEVEVLDPHGDVVLTTGARYRLCPSATDPPFMGFQDSTWVIGGVTPCPSCPLGADVD